MYNVLKSVLIFTFVFLFAACSAQKKNNQNITQKITIKNAWTRSANKGVNSAAYLTIVNHFTKADTLLAIKTDVAKMAGVHQTTHHQGMTGMKEAGTIVIDPNATFQLKPGGYHIMLMNLNRSLAKNDSIQITLNFAISGTTEVTIPVGKQNHKPSK